MAGSGLGEESGWSTCREALMEAGKWDFFVKKRDEIKKQGVPAATARWQSLSAVMMQMLRERDMGMKEKQEGVVPVEVTPETFAGKACTDDEARKWVAENIGYKKVSPESAPSAIAWFMLEDYKCRPEDFWNLYNKPAAANRGVGAGRNGAQTKGNVRDVNAMVAAARIVKVRAGVGRKGASEDVEEGAGG